MPAAKSNEESPDYSKASWNNATEQVMTGVFQIFAKNQSQNSAFHLKNASQLRTRQKEKQFSEKCEIIFRVLESGIFTG